MVKVACCWDDGVVNDIRLIELLRKYHAKATFNLNPGNMTPQRGTPEWVPPTAQGWSYQGFRDGKVGLNELRDIYGDFQVASHGWFHKHAHRVSTEEFIKDAVDARKYLEDVFQRECPGFAWPHGAYTTETCYRMLEEGFAYGRTTEYTDHVGKTDAPMRLQSSCHYLNWQFNEKFQAAKASGDIFYFWGHSYEMMDCENLWRQLEMKLAMLAADPDVEWIDVIDIVRPKVGL